jgi:hypothetical protein
MGRQRLIGSFLLSTETDAAELLERDKIIDDFAWAETSRKTLEASRVIALHFITHDSMSESRISHSITAFYNGRHLIHLTYEFGFNFCAFICNSC